MRTNTIYFSSGEPRVEVLRLSKDGIWANPDIPADDAAKFVLNAIGYNIEVLVQKAVEDEREACAKLCDGINKVYKNPEDEAEQIVSQWCAEVIRARGQA
jgi:hypothetical protein